MVTCALRSICLLLIVLFSYRCTNTVTTDTGGASETIAVYTKDSTIFGKATIPSENDGPATSSLNITIFDDDYITFIDTSSINIIDSTITDSSGYFQFSNVITGAYNLFAQNPQTGKSVFIKNIVVSGIDDTAYDTLSVPGSVAGNVKAVEVYTDTSGNSIYDTVSATLYDVYIPGSPFVTGTDANGNFVLDNISTGTYDLLSMRARDYIDSTYVWNTPDTIISVINDAGGKEVNIKSGINQFDIQILLAGNKSDHK